MSDSVNNFVVLPWEMPVTLPHFVPQFCRYFVLHRHSIFIAWRSGTALVFTFDRDAENLSTQKPLCSQVISSEECVLDVVIISDCIYFVSQNGRFQVLCSQQGERLEQLAKCQSFFLVNAFELSPLKKILSVSAIPEDGQSELQSAFAVVTCSKEGNKIDAELYTVSKALKKPEFRLDFIIHINNGSHSKVSLCLSALLSSTQARVIFPEFKDAEILIVALETGQLFCVPFYISTKKYAMRPTARLIYQHNCPIVGLACPQEGFNIYVFCKGGTCLRISPHPNNPDQLNHSCLSYNSFTLPYPIKSFSVCKSDLLVVTDANTTNVVRVVCSAQVDMLTIPLRGVSALTTISSENLMVASTFHNVFYLLDPSNCLQRKENDSPPWAGCDLDVSLQLIQDMKSQTELLSKLRKELEEEDCIIKALATAARAPILGANFTVSVKVLRTHEVYENPNCEETGKPIIEFDTHQQSYQLSIEIQNDSPEDFNPLLWKLHIQIRNQDGMSLSKVAHLSRPFNRESAFSATVNVPYLQEQLPFPVTVDASLIAEIKDEDTESLWTRIRLNTVTLDISHFFTVSLQPPQNTSACSPSVLTFLNQMQSHFMAPVPHSKSIEENAMMTTYVIPILEKFRQPHIIIAKILSNCQHRHKFASVKDLFNEGDKTVIWLSVLEKLVKLVFRKSCASLSISSINLPILHDVKLCLATMLNEDFPQTSGSPMGNSAYPKAKNLHAVLETLSLDEVQDEKQLLVIHQDLRNNVSSQIY